jgi:hypothetical protein
VEALLEMLVFPGPLLFRELQSKLALLVQKYLLY